MSASKTEGFGIPIIESQLCGTPVITNQCSAMPENTYYGICTKPDNQKDGYQSYYNMQRPSIKAIINALISIYNKKIKITDEIYTKIQNNYRLETMYKKWGTIIDSLNINTHLI